MMHKTTLLALVVLSLAACKGDVTVQADTPEPFGEQPAAANNNTFEHPEVEDLTPVVPVEAEVDDTLPLVVDPPEMTGDEAVFYLRNISQMLAGRPLSAAETERLTTEKQDAIRPILESWVAEPGFAENARYMMQQKLRASGQRDGIDFDAPGRIVAQVVGNNQPWSNVLTADYCVDAEGTQGACDSGAPYNAGVLTTRAFLAGNAGRFNLGRASRMLAVFACRGYPMEDTLQPRIEKPALIPMFRAQTPEEQTVEEAKDAFGNGAACYTCHGQFGPHAQFFVKFAEDGTWVGAATGLQDPEGELGRSIDGLMTSHMDDPTAAASEASTMFGSDVDNLRGAAQALATSEAFVPCSVRNVIEHTFGMTDSAAEEIDRKLLAAVSHRATQGGTLDPTLANIVVETFIDPRLIDVVLETKGDAQ